MTNENFKQEAPAVHCYCHSSQTFCHTSRQMGPVESSECLRVMHACVFEQDSATVPNGVASWSMRCWFGARASLTPVNPLHSALLFLAAIWLHHPDSDAGTAVSTANQSQWLRLKLFKTQQIIAHVKAG